MQVLSNLSFDGSGLVLDFLDDFPSDPFEGKLALVTGVLYIYTRIGVVETWYPLTNRMSQYTHTQGLASNLWDIEHNLNISEFTCVVLDIDNKPIQGTQTIIDSNHIQITFSAEHQGRCVIFFNTNSYYTKEDVDDLLANDDSITDGNFKKILHIQEQRSSGTSAGTSTGRSYNDDIRNINTVLTNNITDASLNNNIVTLPAGEYYIVASAPGIGCGSHQLNLKTGTGTALLNGTSEYTSTRTSSTTRSNVSGVITLETETNITLEHYTDYRVYTYGLGYATSNGEVEVYTDLKIWKL